MTPTQPRGSSRCGQTGRAALARPAEGRARVRKHRVNDGCLRTRVRASAMGRPRPARARSRRTPVLLFSCFKVRQAAGTAPEISGRRYAGFWSRG